MKIHIINCSFYLKYEITANKFPHFQIFSLSLLFKGFDFSLEFQVALVTKPVKISKAYGVQ